MGCVRTAQDVGAGIRQADTGGKLAGRSGASWHEIPAGPGRRGDGAHEDRKHVQDPTFRDQPRGSGLAGAGRLSLRPPLRVHPHGPEGDGAWRLMRVQGPAACDTGAKRKREPASLVVQDHQDVRQLPERRGGNQAAVSGDPKCRRPLEAAHSLDRRQGAVCDSVRRSFAGLSALRPEATCPRHYLHR